jgi:hypothetical protein
MLIWILFWFMLVMLVGSTPAWPHSRGWGYYPSSGITFLLVVFLCIWMFGGFSTWAHQAWWGQPVPVMTK